MSQFSHLFKNYGFPFHQIEKTIKLAKTSCRKIRSVLEQKFKLLVSNETYFNSDPSTMPIVAMLSNTQQNVCVASH